jgi:hypothetical protein
MIIRPVLAAAAVLAFLAACQTPEAEAPASPAAEAAPAASDAAAPAASAWTTIAPGGDTLCATGTPFTFHVREGDASRVIIFLNGGGACWSGDLCDLNTEPTPYTPFAEMDSNDPATKGGVFDAANPENPFAGWTQVFVSYCTGDAHLGARDVNYPTSAGGTVTIHHRGKANVQSALDWVYAHTPAPQRVFVGGGSAGAIASPYYAGIVADHYPQAEVVQYGGGAGGYRTPTVSGLLETWGAFDSLPDWPAFAALDTSKATIEDFFRVTAARHPEMRMAQFNNVDDDVQQQFLMLLGTMAPMRGLLHDNLAELSADLPHFRSYSAPGTDHTLVRFDRLYTTEVGGVRAVDWIRDLAEGRDVATVSCETDSSCD